MNFFLGGFDTRSAEKMQHILLLLLTQLCLFT